MKISAENMELADSIGVKILEEFSQVIPKVDKYKSAIGITTKIASALQQKENELRTLAEGMAVALEMSQKWLIASYCVPPLTPEMQNMLDMVSKNITIYRAKFPKQQNGCV